jgi:cell division protein FtsQ
MDGGGRFGGSLIPNGPQGPGGFDPASGGSLAAAADRLRAALPQGLVPRGLRPRRASVAVPWERRIPKRAGTVLVFAFFGTVAWTGLVAGGHYDAFVEREGRPLDAFARIAGFGLERVTIAGLQQLREDEILRDGGLDARKSLAFLSVAEVRDRLAAMPLVGAVSVRKIYPHELLVTITEREPSALWQKDGEVFVISADGTVIDRMRDGRFASLPLVVGEGANTRTREYLALVEAAGPLKGRIRAGTLVSGRRWTLKLDGVDVRLPETGAAEAMARLVRLEDEAKVLEKDIIAVDLRMPDRLVVRLTEEAAAARAEVIKKQRPRGKGIET